LLFFKRDKSLKDKFPSRWLPKIFTIVPEPFSEENKMLNSTLKMVRYKITEAYKDLIDTMYQDGAGNLSNHNIKVLENKFFKN
jgi:long-chain acyl-CoA synthetase